MKPPSTLLLILFLAGLAACAGERPTSLPELAATAEESVAGACGSVFPRGRWQFTHSIEYSRAGGESLTVLGVTSLDGREVGCALVTVEGFTLFAAVSGEHGKLEVRRAVPPFDKPGFAEGLMRDVRLIFLQPSADTVLYGRLGDTAMVCRYVDAAGRVTDVLPAVGGCWRINAFSPESVIDRSLGGRSCRRVDGVLVPEYLELEDFGPNSYTLRMTLVNAENLNRTTQR